MATRLIIAGGRHYRNEPHIHAKIRAWIRVFGTPDIVITGGATGVDKIAKRFTSRELSIPQEEVFPQWYDHGKKAGPLRNRKMAEMATHLLAFWDGHSRGTLNMIRTANDMGLNVTVVMYRRDPQQ